MADVLALRDEYRAQNWAMVIQECNSSGGSRRRHIITGFGSSVVRWRRQLEPPLTPIQDDVLQIRCRGVELKLPVGVDMDTVAALLRSLQAL